MPVPPAQNPGPIPGPRPGPSPVPDGAPEPATGAVGPGLAGRTALVTGASLPLDGGWAAH